MKRTLTRKTAYALLGGALLLGAGCAKEASLNEQYRPAGTPIVFSTATSYKNGDGTRTEYSGLLYGETTEYERIDWLAEDEMTIAYVHAGETSSADYVVTSATGSSQTSTASVEAVSASSKLTWGSGAGNHVFYGMYPANGFNGNNTASLTNSHHVQGAIPSASQAFHVKDGRYLPPMQYAYMVSCKEIGGDSHESRVTLPFTPAVTAFQFRLQRRTGDPNAKITGVELTATTPLTGTFAFDITGGDENGAIWNKSTTGSNPTVLSGPGNTLTYTFPVTGGVNIPASGGTDFLDFTLLALPVEQTGLRLKLIYANGTTKTLDLSDGVFQAAKKTIITNRQVPGGSWEYHISNLSAVTVAYTGGTGTLGSGFVSYKTDGSSNQAVPFVLEYSENGTSGWSTTKPDWITPSGNFNGSTTGQTLTASVAAQTAVVSSPHREAMRVKTEKSDYDLSRKNWGTGDETTNSPGWTSNCYIVDAPGTYKIPLVYGNAFNNGSPNQPAFRGNFRNSGYWYRYGYGNNTGGDKEFYLGTFRDHRAIGDGTDGLITTVQHSQDASSNDAYITTKGWGTLSAAVIWSDVTNLVTNLGINGNYLTFKVDKNYIDEGNALVAVKNSAGTILWSWHIWVTDMMSNSSGFAPVNLGYCDGIKSTVYPQRTYYVRAAQTETGGLTTTSVLIKETAYSVTGSASPYNTYYQWGRKDPLRVGKYSNDGTTNSAALGVGIQNPTTYYSKNDNWNAVYFKNADGNSGSNRWDYPLNLWNSSTGNPYSSNQYQSGDQAVTKTIYDPCPSGYKVPNRELFSPSTSAFPQLGTLLNTSSGGYYWTATVYNASQAQYWYYNGSWSENRTNRKDALAVRPYRE